MDLTWNVERRGGLAVVTCLLCNDAPVDRRVRLRNELEGPVLPPRRRGVPEPGWDRDGYTCRVDGNSTVGVGYVCASLTAADRRPMTIESVEEVGDGDDDTAAGRTEPDDAGVENAVSNAIRTLGDHRPPRESVPINGNGGDGGEGGSPTNGPETANAGPPVTERRETGATAPGPSDAESSRETSTEDEADAVAPIDGKRSNDQRQPIDEEAMARIESRIDAMDEDLDRLRRLTEADLETAATVVAEAGDLASLESDVDRIAADVDDLGRLRDRIDEVIERHDRLEIPIESLRRIA
jgi:hypothetical protein